MAADLVKQGEAKLKVGMFGYFTGGPKYDEAQDLFQQAANQYKLAKDWPAAADCFERCANCAKEGGSPNEEANFYQEAGNVLKKVSSADAIVQYEKTIQIYNTGGRFSQSGKLLMQMAELLEAERMNHKDVKDYYKRAAEMFDLDDHGKSNLTKCNLKVADYAAKDGELQEAIQIFESEGEKALSNNLLRYGAKEHFLKAGILHMVMGDTVTVNLACEKYFSLDPTFQDSREGKLLAGMAEAFTNTDADMFIEKLSDYDTVTPLDSWKTDFLVKVKESMAPGGVGDTDLS